MFTGISSSQHHLCGFVIVSAVCCVWLLVCVLSSSQTTGCQQRATGLEKVLSLAFFSTSIIIGALLILWAYSIKLILFFGPYCSWQNASLQVLSTIL